MKTRRFLVELHGPIPVTVYDAPGEPPESGPAPSPGPWDPDSPAVERLAEAYERDPAAHWKRLAKVLHASGLSIEEVEARFDAIATTDATDSEIAAAKKIVLDTVRALAHKAQRRKRIGQHRHPQPEGEVIAYPGKEPSDADEVVSGELADEFTPKLEDAEHDSDPNDDDC